MKTAIRNGFSDRTGKSTVNTTIQYNDLDLRSRVALVNKVREYFKKLYRYDDSYEKKFTDDIMANVYCHELSSHYSYHTVLEYVRTTIVDESYDHALSIIEYLAKWFGKEFCEEINDIFQREYVGYRFINRIIAPITDEAEISAIEKSLDSNVDKIKIHINKALGLLSDRDNPDYENSIKESISSVEAKCTEVLGKKGTLGDLLKSLKNKGIVIHPAMEKAMDSLYGYTSDGTGIRHAGDINGPNATFDEANFMLVVCCAFINYINGNMQD